MKTKQSNNQQHQSIIMVSSKALFLALAVCVIFQVAIASELSIYKGPNCFEDHKKKSIVCSDGHGVGHDHGHDHACINFGDHDVSYTFKYYGTPLKLYYGAGCSSQPAVSHSDIGCTQVANAKSYKLLCNRKGY